MTDTPAAAPSAAELGAGCRSGDPEAWNARVERFSRYISAIATQAFRPTAATDVTLLALEREPFVAAVAGHEPARATADEVIAARLGAFDPGIVKL